MSIEKFDPYGSVLPDSTRGEAEPPKAAPILLSRVGQSIFWLLVVFIVASRIAYFSSNVPLHFVDVRGTTISGIVR
jgi:hypothetical protein